MTMLMNLPKLYAIVDVSCFAAPLRTTAAIVDYARELAAGGATLIQYRNKVGTTREMLSHARELRHALGEGVTLIMNDRADICIAAEFEGVHVGQDDLSPEGARTVIGAESHPRRFDAQPRTIAGSRCRPSGLHCVRAGLWHVIETQARSCCRSRRHSRSACGYEEAAGRHRWHHSRQCPLGDRCGSRFGRSDFRPSELAHQSCCRILATVGVNSCQQRLSLKEAHWPLN